jgi:hypothetical protein
MKSFKQYLTEAKKGVTRDEAKSLSKRVKSALRPEDFEPISKRGDEWFTFMIRDYKYFTPRPGEEDDDWPDFTGEKDLMRKLNPIFKGIEWKYSPEEKDWISINIKAKKLSAAAAKKDTKKKTAYVIDAVDGEKDDAEDRNYREFYTILLPLLKKWKKKSITKDEFYAMGETIRPWFDVDAAEEAWSMAK